MNREYFIYVASLLSVLGYVLLFYALYRLSDASESKRLKFFLLTALGLFFPGIYLFCLSLWMDIGSFEPGPLGRLYSTILYPWFSLIPILITLFFVRKIQHQIQFRIDGTDATLPEEMSNKLITEAQMNKAGTVLLAGGCALPCVLTIITFVILCSMGLHLLNHDYRPAMDGPQPIIQWQGIDLVFLVDYLSGLAWFSVFGFLILASLFMPSIRNSFKLKWGEVLTVFAIIAVLFLLLVPAVLAARETSKKPQCKNMLKQLGLAMWHYQDVYGSLPPAYTIDPDGKPLHSWRVLLLPFLEHQADYEKIRLNEPWDSEHNRPFWILGDPFCCPTQRRTGCFLVPYYPTYGRNIDSSPAYDHCDYSVIVGPETLFPGSETRSLNNLSKEDLNKTLLIVERKTPICWMDPTQELKNESEIGSSKHPHPTVLYADAHVEELEQ